MAFLLLQTAQLAATHEIAWATKSPGHKGDEITIVSGDSLIFGDGDGGTWAGGHDVFKVTATATATAKSNFDKCEKSQQAGTRLESGNWKKHTTTPDVGTHYYICTYGNHCSWGQKIKVTVTAKAEANPYCHASCPQSLSGTEDEPVTELDQSDGNRYGYRHVDESKKDCTCDLQSCSPFRSTTAEWFRFAGTSGSMIATCPVTGGGATRCGTTGATGYMLGGHPEVGAPPAARTLQFSYGSNTYDTDSSAAMVCACSYDGGVTTSYSYKLSSASVRPSGMGGMRRICGADTDVCEAPTTEPTNEPEPPEPEPESEPEPEPEPPTKPEPEPTTEPTTTGCAANTMPSSYCAKKCNTNQKCGKAKCKYCEKSCGKECKELEIPCPKNQKKANREAKQSKCKPITSSNATQKCAKNKISKKCAATCRAALDLPACSCTRKKCELPSA